MGASRRNYTDQYKEQAIELAQEIGLAQAAKDLGINPSNIERWRKMSSNSTSKPKVSKDRNSLEQELLKAKKENRYLRKVNDVLKKSLGIFAEEKKNLL